MWFVSVPPPLCGVASSERISARAHIPPRRRVIDVPPWDASLIPEFIPEPQCPGFSFYRIPRRVRPGVHARLPYPGLPTGSQVGGDGSDTPAHFEDPLNSASVEGDGVQQGSPHEPANPGVFCSDAPSPLPPPSSSSSLPSPSDIDSEYLLLLRERAIHGYAAEKELTKIFQEITKEMDNFMTSIQAFKGNLVAGEDAERVLEMRGEREGNAIGVVEADKEMRGEYDGDGDDHARHLFGEFQL